MSKNKSNKKLSINDITVINVNKSNDDEIKLENRSIDPFLFDNENDNNISVRDDVSYNTLEKNNIDIEYTEYNIDNNDIKNNENFKSINLNNLKRDLLIKIGIVICLILILIILFKLFIFNNKNKFLKETTNIYNNIISVIDNIDEEFYFLDNDYININSNINIKDIDNNNNVYKLNYIEDNNSNNIELYYNNELNNIDVNNLDLFGNKADDVRHVLSLIKKTVYKAIDINKFESKKVNSNEEKIVLNLDNEDIKKILVRVLQKIKLNTRSVELISGYLNLSSDELRTKIDKLLDEVRNKEYKDFVMEIYYKKDVYKYVIKYNNYIITYNIDNNNCVIKNNNQTLVDINISNNNITSNNNSKYNITYSRNDEILKFRLTNNNNELNVVLLYNISEEDGKYNLDIDASINSSFSNINSIGVSSDTQIINKK